MRLAFVVIAAAVFLTGCATSPSTYSSYTPTYTPTYKPTTYRNYITGPRGGCYYINSNGNKTYVDRSMC